MCGASQADGAELSRAIYLADKMRRVRRRCLRRAPRSCYDECTRCSLERYERPVFVTRCMVGYGGRPFRNLTITKLCRARTWSLDLLVARPDESMMNFEGVCRQENRPLTFRDPPLALRDVRIVRNFGAIRKVVIRLGLHALSGASQRWGRGCMFATSPCPFP